MVATLIARDVSVVRGAQVVLDAIDVTIAPGHRIGLVGPNGVGKTTLLRALAGIETELDRGSVELMPPTAVVGLLPQQPERSPSESVREFLGRRCGIRDADVELDSTTAALAAGSPSADDRYALALDRWLTLGAADFDARVGVVWSELGLDRRLLAQPMSVLSGGEAARCSLASLLLARFDVFLLDEPTNNLDLDGLARLEEWVMGLRAGVVIVSHDRTFLQRVITDVVEIDFHTHRARRFAGGWAAFLAERELEQAHAQARFDEFDSKRSEILARAQREREWATQGRARVKRSDESDKNIRSYKINQTEQLAGKAARTERMLERLAEVDEPRTPWELRLDIPSAGRSGDLVVSCRAAVVDRGQFRLGPIDLDVQAGERIALVGSNGAGKSTLLEVMLGRTAPDSGSVRLGASVVIGEIEQARDRLGGDETLLEAFMAATVSTSAQDTRSLLAKFGLVAEHIVRRAGTLSPGERTRASLAMLMANGANVLVLDEPTNHLDLPAIEQLEAAIDTFAGTVILVTHDRSLLQRTRITRTIELFDGRVHRDVGEG